MPRKRDNWRRCPRGAQVVQNGEPRLESGNEERPILVPAHEGWGLDYEASETMSIHICKTVAYPMAKVLQSAAGASDVIAIWSIVLAEMCSEVVGSNRITFPLAATPLQS